MFSPTPNSTKRKLLAVANYRDPYYKRYRQVVRICLAFVLPLIVVAVLAYIIIGYISDNLASQPTVRESNALNDIPVPIGSIRAPAATDAVWQEVSTIEKVWMGSYNAGEGQTEAYLVNVPDQQEPIAWMGNYYQQKLAQIKPKPWALQRNIIYNGKIEVPPTSTGAPIGIKQGPVQGQYLFIQVIANGQIFGGLFIDYRLVTAQVLKDNPGLYGPQAKDGQLYVVLTKNILRKSF
jgi:hypothetical protein